MKVMIEIRDRQIKMIKKISDNASKELDNCISVTATVLEINESFRFVNEAAMGLIDWQNSCVDEGENLFANLHSAEQRVRGFLFEVRSYLDHMETTLKREYGKESDEVSIFKKATNDAYDSLPFYPFVYHLRDYSQHCNTIVDCLDNDNTKKVSAYAFVSKLKEKNHKKWNSLDINFLDAQKDGKVDLIDVFMKEYQALDQHVHVKVMKKLINQNDVGNCLKWLRDFADMNFERENAKYFHYADIQYLDGSDATVDDFRAKKSNVTFVVKAIDWRAVYQATDSMGLGV